MSRKLVSELLSIIASKPLIKITSYNTFIYGIPVIEYQVMQTRYLCAYLRSSRLSAKSMLQGRPASSGPCRDILLADVGSQPEFPVNDDMTILTSETRHVAFSGIEIRSSRGDKSLVVFRYLPLLKESPICKSLPALKTAKNDMQIGSTECQQGHTKSLTCLSTKQLNPVKTSHYRTWKVTEI